MKRHLIAGAAALLLLPLSAGAKPVATKQASMTGGVRAVFDTDSRKDTVYGSVIPLTFTKQDAGKMLEILVDSPKPVLIELWSGDIPRGATSWDKSRKFLGNSGRAPEAKPAFRWMIEPGNYTALVLATLPPGQKPDSFFISWGKEVRVPSEKDTNEWNLAVAKFTVNRILQSQAKRAFVPNFSAIAVDKNPVSPQQYRGKVLLIHFFSGNDQPMLDEIGYLHGLHANLKDQGFEMIGVCLDTEQTAFDAIQEQFHPTWRQLFDGRTGNSAIADKYGIEEYMENLLVDASGRIVARNLHRLALSKILVATIDEAKAYQQAQKIVDDAEAATVETTDVAMGEATAK